MNHVCSPKVQFSILTGSIQAVVPYMLISNFYSHAMFSSHMVIMMILLHRVQSHECVKQCDRYVNKEVVMYLKHRCILQWQFMLFVLLLVRLCVAALSVNSFCGSREALYGVFDGDRNVEVPYLLQCTMNDVLAEELHKTKSEEDYMTNTFLVMQRCVISSPHSHTALEKK